MRIRWIIVAIALGASVVASGCSAPFGHDGAGFLWSMLSMALI
jgi:hypothetical protein